MPLGSLSVGVAPSQEQCSTKRRRNTWQRVSQTVVRVRERKQRKKCEGLPATGAAAAPDPDPIVRFVRLLTAASVTNDRIAFTSGASPPDDFRAARRPIRFELVWGDGKWDKQNRSSSGLCSSGVDPPRSQPEAELLPPEAKNPNWRRIQLLDYRCLRGVTHRIGR
jgi:hypothetical protein